MDRLSDPDYRTLRRHAEVLEADAFGDKVLRLGDGRFLKLFRRKRLLSSAAWYPYAQRFADNALALSAKGIPCPRVEGVFRIPSIERDAVLYHPLAGQTLRDWGHAHADTLPHAALHRRFNEFVAHLHQQGIYFRSLHLGNVVLTPEGRLGLIDIADLRFYRGPLGKLLRRRNLRRIHDNPIERDWLDYEQLVNLRPHNLRPH